MGHYKKLREYHKMKYFGVIAALTIATSTAIHAKEYLGFNLCSETTKAKVEEVLKGHSATIVNTKSDFVGAFTYNTRDFKIKGKGYPVEVTIFNGKLYAVSTMLAADLFEDINQLYGKPIKTSSEPNGMGTTKAWVYEDKENSGVSITLSQASIKVQNQQVEISALAYLCKGLSSEAETLVNQEKAKKSKASGL